jgi:SAM-dependent methyltransferase
VADALALGRKARDRLVRVTLPALIERVAERQAGASTAGKRQLSDLGLDEQNRLWYQPTDWFALNRLLRRIELRPEDVFVDYGAGKGRTLLAAARLPFARVLGLELSPELADEARANLARNEAKRRAGEVRVEVGDAMEWQPPDDMSVVFMFCPFTGPVFRAAFERLLASLERAPRPLLFLYSHPFEHNYVLSTGRATVIDVTPARLPSWGGVGGQVIVTYVLTPSEGGAEQRDFLRRPRVEDGRWRGYTDAEVEVPNATPLVAAPVQ